MLIQICGLIKQVIQKVKEKLNNKAQKSDAATPLQQNVSLKNGLDNTKCAKSQYQEDVFVSSDEEEYKEPPRPVNLELPYQKISSRESEVVEVTHVA